MEWAHPGQLYAQSRRSVARPEHASAETGSRSESGQGGAALDNAARSVIADNSVKPAPALIRPYVPELDSMRGIAVLMVLFLHCMTPPLNASLPRWGQIILSVSEHGGVGVNLFFVLSGFLITGILIANKDRPDYYRHFYTRRALRILPALYAVLLILLLGGWIGWRFLVVSLLFLANFVPLLGVHLQYPVLWSLAVEEHFYMLWPALVRRFSSKSLIFLLIAICVATPLLRAAIFLYAHNPQTPIYSWFNLDGLAFGALLAIWLRSPSFRRSHLSRLAGPLFIGSAAAFLFLAAHPGLAASSFSILSSNLASAGLLSSMLLLGTSQWSFVVDRPFLKFMGFISYGLYLVHILAFKLVGGLFDGLFRRVIHAGMPTAAMLMRFLMGAALAIGIAYLSRVSLEKSFLEGEFPRLRAVRSDPANLRKKS
jgi:peptidoglycan/LPS O-acetylase OafA/YrhL